jgi:hypothetical protein
MVAMADMTDQYGNTNTEMGVRLTYTRSVIDKIDWPGFESRVLTDPADAFNVATSYFIHPAIFKNVKIDGLDSAVKTSDN